MTDIPANGALIELARRFSSLQALSGHLGVPRTTLYARLQREGRLRAVQEALTGGAEPRPMRARLKIEDDQATLVSKAAPELRTPEEVMRGRGLDPEEWEVVSLVVNEWDAPAGGDEIKTMRQLKLGLRRRKKLSFITPAIEVAYTAPRKFRRGGPSELIVVVSDQQAPYQDPHLHELFRQWLERNRPHRGVLAGDTLDFPTISRHRDNPEWHVDAQECINSGYLLLRDYVRASEGTRWTKLMGNHDERLRTELLNRAERMYGIRPADIPGEPEAAQALSLRHLLHLDSLGIELEEPRGNYTHAQVTLSDRLMVRHGWLTGANTAAQSLKALNCSLLVAHTHRQTKATRAVYDSRGRLDTTLLAYEIGCMCRIEGGLGYAVDPMWANGFATVSLWPDGRFQVDLAQYVEGALFWRKQRFE